MKILNQLGHGIILWLHDVISKAKRNSTQKKAQKTYEAVKNNPQSTAEEVGKAYEEYQNAGRVP